MSPYRRVQLVSNFYKVFAEMGETRKILWIGRMMTRAAAMMLRLFSTWSLGRA
jgi:hypothetical protein